MSFIFELYYAAPEDLARERCLIAKVGGRGGKLTCRELPAAFSQAIVLVFEFDDFDQAEAAESELRLSGEHTEGVSDYGD